MNLSMLFLLLAFVNSTVSNVVNDERGLVFENHADTMLSIPLELKNVTQQTSKVDDKMDCVFACTSQIWCRSANYKVIPEKDGKHLCELISADGFTHQNYIKENSSYILLSIKNPCEKNPCLNDGLCSVHRRIDYKCKCKEDFTGENCEVPKNCAEVLKYGGKQSGVYSIDPDGKGSFKVYCDQKTNGGGWTVFQKRKDGSVDFYRGWNDYKNRFGDLKGEFWLGLDKINRLTHQVRNRLRVEVKDTGGNSAHADYDYFAVADESNNYKLSLGTYSGTAGDSLTYHRGESFTTKDRDNDSDGGNCAVQYKGAWWYKGCHESNLNGLYYHDEQVSHSDGVVWYHWKGNYYSAKRAEMKIKPI